MEKEFEMKFPYADGVTQSDIVKAYSGPLFATTFDFTALWNQVSVECNRILNWPSWPDFKGQTAIQRVMRVYTIVYRLASTRCSECPKLVRGTGAQEDIVGNGNEGTQGLVVYYFLREMLRTHLSSVVYLRLQRSLDTQSCNLLKVYLSEWKTFVVAVNHLKVIFSYLHAPWQKFGLPLVHPLLPTDALALVQWTETIMSEGICQSLSDQIFALSSRDRLHRLDKESTEILREISHSLGMLNTPRHSLYLTLVEEPYVAQLHEFYTRQIGTIKAGGILSYLQRSLMIFEDETDRVNRFFAKSTVVPVRQRLADIFVDSELSYLKHYLRDWILNNRVFLLNKMYQLLLKSSMGLVALKEVFEASVFEKGLEDIKKICEDSTKSNEELCRAILKGVISVHAYFENVRESFEGNELIEKAMIVGLEEILVSLPYVKNHQALGEELARLVHEKLKSAEEGDHCEAMLKEIVTVFQLLPSKNSFLESYPRYLSIRLLSDVYREENENLAIQMISQAKDCNNDFVHRCKVMLTDITESSALLHKEFNLVCADRQGASGDLDFVPVVISSYSWPDFSRDVRLPIPRILGNKMQEFQRFFLQVRAKRNITFASQFSRGVVRMNLPLGFRIPSVDLYMGQCQLLIAECFNNQTGWALEKLLQVTNIPDQALFLRSLNDFTRHGILEVYDQNGTIRPPLRSVMVGQHVHLVPNPDIKKRRIKLFSCDYGGTRDFTQGTNNDFANEPVDASHVVDQAKDPAIQATLIRIFKANGNLLFTELMEKIEHLFYQKPMPSVQQVKLALEFLISRGFISRSDVNEGRFSYLC